MKNSKSKEDKPTEDTLEDILNDTNDSSSSSNKKTKKKSSLFGGKRLFGSKKKSNSSISAPEKASAEADDFLASLDKEAKPKEPDKLKMLFGVVMILLLLALAAYFYSAFIKDETKQLSTVDAAAQPKPAATGSKSIPVTEGTSVESGIVIEANEDTEAEAAEKLKIDEISNVPNPEDILSADLPESEVVAKEEIDRLADEAVRLEKQGKLIEDQVAMMDELTEKKAEQIELLEQQIAQLEVQKNSK